MEFLVFLGCVGFIALCAGIWGFKQLHDESKRANA